ncbi:unnamed protein product [Brugia timori]|uniref:Uncharacterized protein n=1 Tax=Brugia timori TaxID=42155 RepID=A0A0R3QCX6_9BILA|nr:unnamed protein product [Brugia timori]
MNNLATNQQVKHKLIYCVFNSKTIPATVAQQLNIMFHLKSCSLLVFFKAFQTNWWAKIVI